MFSVLSIYHTLTNTPIPLHPPRMEAVRADIIYTRSKQMAAVAPSNVRGAAQLAASLEEAAAVCSKQTELAAMAIAKRTQGEPAAAADVAAAQQDVVVPNSQAQFAETVMPFSHDLAKTMQMLKRRAARDKTLPVDVIKANSRSTELPQVVAAAVDDQNLGDRKLLQVRSWSSNYTASQKRKLNQAVGQFTLINNPDLGECFKLGGGCIIAYASMLPACLVQVKP